MKKVFTFLLGLVPMLAMSYGQNIVVDDFEGSAKSWQEGQYIGTSGVFTLSASTHFVIASNPWAFGANTSAKVGKFTNFSVSDVAFSLSFSNQIWFSRYPKLTFNALSEVVGTVSDTVVAVLYNSTDGFKSSLIAKTYILANSGDWDVFELDLSPYASKLDYYNTIGFMINPNSEDAVAVNIDNITFVYDAVNTKEVVFNETFGTAVYVETSDYVSGFSTYGSGLISGVTMHCKNDYYKQEYLDLDGGTDSIKTSTRVQLLRPDSTDAVVHIFSPWIPNYPYPIYFQPYNDASGISCGIYPNTSLYFKSLKIKGLTNLNLGFAYMNHTYNLPVDNWEVAIRPTVFARVDGGTWTKLTTASAFPALTKQTYVIKAYDGVTDSTVQWYQNAMWFYIEYPVASTGSTMDVAISNQSWSIDFFAQDGVTPEYPGAQSWMKFLLDNVSLKGDLVTIPTKVNTIAEKSPISIYNAQGTLYINSEKAVKAIVIYDVSGRKVKAAANVSAVNISMLKKGVYIVKVQTVDGKSTTSKILK